MTEGATLGLMLLLALPTQDEEGSPPTPPDDAETRLGLSRMQVRADEVIFSVLDGLRLRFGQVEMRADRALLWSAVPSGEKSAEEDPLHVGPEVPRLDASGSAPKPAAAALGGADPRVNPLLRNAREIYLEGNVLWRRASDTVIFADRLYYDFVEEHGVIIEGNLIAERTKEGRVALGRRTRPDREYSLQVRADEIRLMGLTGLEIHDGEFSTCTYGDPHYHVHTGHTTIDLSPDPESLGAIRVHSEDNHLELGRTPILPLPPFTFTAQTDEGLPIKRVRVGRSSKLGGYLETEWGWDAKEAGDTVHEWLGIDRQFKGDFELKADMMTRRGPALGPGVDYSSPGLYRGEIGTYFVHDRAEEDHGDLDQPQVSGQGDPLRFDVNHPLRGRAFTRNRFFLSEDGPEGPWSLDLEAHWMTDEGFRREFLEREFKEAKEPESYAHLVRREGTTRFRTLYRNRLNDFDTQLDSLPRVSFDQAAFPLIPLPLPEGAGPGYLVLDQYHEAANLRRHPSDDIDVRSARVMRMDSVVELSTPFDLGPFGLRPFANGRFTGYDETVGDRGSIGRFASQVGARTQLPFHRDFDAYVPALQIDGLRHVLVLDAGYEHTVFTSKDPSRFEQLDAVDTVDENEEFLLGIRQRLQTWRGQQVRSFLELDVEIPLYPDEDRDNPVGVGSDGAPVGRTAGPLRVDLAYIPGFTRSWAAGTMFTAEGEYDTNTGRLEVFNAGISVRPRDDWWTRVSYRTLRGRSRIVTGALDYRLTEKWALGMLAQYDLRKKNEALEQRLALRRHGHDFLFELEFERDEGEDDTSLTLNLRPILYRPKARDRGLYDRGTHHRFTDEYDFR